MSHNFIVFANSVPRIIKLDKKIDEVLTKTSWVIFGISCT